MKINIEKLHTTDLIAPKPEGEVVKAKIKDEAAPERHKIRYEWWEQLIKRAGQMTDLHVGLSPSKYHYIGKKRHGFLFAYVIASNFGQVELYIDNGTNSKAENESRFD